MKNKNEFDCKFFKKKLKAIAKDCDSYKPEELVRELDILSKAAWTQYYHTQPVSSRMVGGDLDTSYGY